MKVGSHIQGTVSAAATLGLGTLVKEFTTSSPSLVQTSVDVPVHEDIFDQYISMEEFASRLEASAEHAGNPSFGFIFGSRFDLRNFGPVGYIPRLSRTLGDAFESFCAYFDCIQDNGRLSMEISGDFCTISYDIDGQVDFVTAQDAEATIGLIFGLGRHNEGSDWQCSQLTFKHRSRSDQGLKEELCGVSAQQSHPRNSLVFPKQFLDRPVSTYDQVLLGLVQKAADEFRSTRHQSASVAGDVYGAVQRNLSKGYPVDLEGVAAELLWSKRTLQTRLANNNTTFLEVRTAAVMDTAVNLLRETGVSTTEIGYRLGFSETSAFSRAFRNRFGLSPSKFRRLESSQQNAVLAKANTGIPRSP